MLSLLTHKYIATAKTAAQNCLSVSLICEGKQNNMKSYRRAYNICVNHIPSILVNILSSWDVLSITQIYQSKSNACIRDYIAKTYRHYIISSFDELPHYRVSSCTGHSENRKIGIYIFKI